MKKYTKKCWYCGQKTMVPQGNYWKCNSCGTTWNELPEVGSSSITVIDSETGKAPRFGHLTKAMPSGATKLKAARGRQRALGNTPPKD